MTEISESCYTLERELFMTLDPVHIGSGGYRLGRVDNSIVREPGTNIPKIPGTSLAGAARSYAAMLYGKPDAAGKHDRLNEKAKENCPIIYTFGTATDAGGGQAGTVSIGDAQILLFPVYSSMAGTVWISTKEILENAGFTCSKVEVTDENVATSIAEYADKEISLGWFMAKVASGLSVTHHSLDEKCNEWTNVKNKIVITSSRIFSVLVNSNLEVRTSVSIDSETGAAVDGALFTYEAIPRLTWLYCDVVKDDYRKLNGSGFSETTKQFKNGKENEGDELSCGEWNSPLDVVKSGMRLMEHLGVGGMGTRGFGRMKLVEFFKPEPTANNPGTTAPTTGGDSDGKS